MNADSTAAYFRFIMESNPIRAAVGQVALGSDRKKLYTVYDDTKVGLPKRIVFISANSSRNHCHLFIVWNQDLKGAHTRTSLARESASGSLTREPGSDTFHHTRVSGFPNFARIQNEFIEARCSSSDNTR